MPAPESSKALTKRSASTSLMAPPPAPKRIKRPAIVLDEDTYSSAVAHIIRRDFFPGLAETDAQREYLNALESGDKGWIRESGKTLTQVMTPVPGGRRRVPTEGRGGRAASGRGGETPKTWAGDTPITVAGTEIDEDEERKPEVDLNLSLSAFQSKYISEDQESFSRIIDRQNAKKFEKNAWMRNGNILPSKQRLAQQKVLALEAAKSSSQDVALRPSQDLDKRPAAPTTHKHVPFNTLMFNPDSIESWAPTRAQASSSASLAPPKAVLHHNTRLPVPVPASPPRPSSPTLSAVRDAIAGRPRLTNSEAGFDGSETPRVNGYAFVDAAGPSRHDSDDDDAPTDLLDRLGATAQPSRFTISDAGRRERLHLKMVERINAKNNGREASAAPRSGLGILGRETPKFPSAPSVGMGSGGARARGGLTPAGQRLLERVGGMGKGKGGGGEGAGFAGVGRDWTPTPRVRRRG